MSNEGWLVEMGRDSNKLNEQAQLIGQLKVENERLAKLAAGYETELRKELWLNHGHTYFALYGDDGEMACNACPCDFKRQPFEEVRAAALKSRMEQAALVSGRSGTQVPRVEAEHVVLPSEPHADSQAGLTGPSGSPTLHPGRVSSGRSEEQT